MAAGRQPRAGGGAGREEGMPQVLPDPRYDRGQGRGGPEPTPPRQRKDMAQQEGPWASRRKSAERRFQRAAAKAEMRSGILCDWVSGSRTKMEVGCPGSLTAICKGPLVAVL